MIETKSDSYEIGEYQKDFPPTVKLEKGSTLISCQWRGKSCKGNEFVLRLHGEAGKGPRPRFELSYRTGGKKKKFTLDLLPSLFPKLTQEGKSVSDLPLIFALSQRNITNRPYCFLVRLSSRGEFDFFRYIPGHCGDFRPHEFNGKTFYTYQLVTSGINYVAFIGPRVLLDENFKVIKEIAPQNDGHEFVLLGPDHWIGIEIELGRLKNGRTYVNKRLRERKDGKIINDWGVSDFLSQFGSEATLHIHLSRIRKEVVAELLHLNSVQVLKNGKWLVGLGYEGVGLLDPQKKKLVWVLGGMNDSFHLSVERQPHFNHTPYLNEATNELSLFSNFTWGDITKTEARVLRYTLSDDHKNVSGPEVLRAKGERSRIMGSLQLNGKVMTIGYGTRETGLYDMVEFSENKDTWKISFPTEWAVYRFYRSPMQ